jgi:hypothetical protein
MNTMNFKDENILEKICDKASKDLIAFICPICNVVFRRSKKQIQSALWAKAKQIYCSRACASSGLQTKRCVSCNQCKKNVIKKPSQIHSSVSFCSRSCAVTFNNQKNPKRKKEGVCLGCSESIAAKNKYCKRCRVACEFKPDAPISDFFTSLKSASKFSNIRYHARKYYLEHFMHQCLNCNYQLHIEIAHIKPISSFSDNTPLNVVNSSDNLAGLCKRCHWEMDNGYLSYEQLNVKIPVLRVERR